MYPSWFDGSADQIGLWGWDSRDFCKNISKTITDEVRIFESVVQKYRDPNHLRCLFTMQTPGPKPRTLNQEPLRLRPGNLHFVKLFKSIDPQ